MATRFRFARGPLDARARCRATTARRDKRPIVVIKVGTSSLLKTNDGCVHLSQLCALCETVADLKRHGYHVVLVSSGAVGAGMVKMGIKPSATKPSLARKQALAAIGQPYLMRYYTDVFSSLGASCAQVLLTLENLSNRTQYQKAKQTFEQLCSNSGRFRW